MSEVTSSDWAVTVLGLGVVALYCFFLGYYLVQLIERMDLEKKRKLYRKWAVEKDIFGPQSEWVLAFLFASHVLGASMFIFIVISAESIEMTIAASNFDHKMIIGMVSFYAFFAGLILKNQSVTNVRMKVNLLEGLAEVYHKRFSVPELLSMYESLRWAPPNFWEEYSNLPHHNITQKTNQEYREWAASFRHTETSNYSRALMTVTILIFLLTAAILVVELLL